MKNSATQCIEKPASAAKHAPATPLPWKQGEIKGTDGANGECLFDEVGDIVADCGSRATLAHADWPECEANASYIAQAANAYPKLVEALGEALRAWEKPNPTHTPTYRKNYERLTGLLRELGEAS